MLEETLSGFIAMSPWEYIAVAFSLMYVLFAIKQSSWCWPAAFVSTSIYTLLFWQGALLMESLLNFYYLIMAVFGFYQWQFVKASSDPVNASGKRPVVQWPFQTHLLCISFIAIVTVVVGYLLDEYTHANMAYLDTFTTTYALFATYLLTQKILENWLYWVAIDLSSIYLYADQGFYPTAILFILYTGFAIHGYFTWRADMIKNTETSV